MLQQSTDSLAEDPQGGPAAASAVKSIGSSTLRASLWTIGGYAAGQALRLGSNLILTRLLFPAVFGEVALVFVFIQGLAMFSDVGTGPAIIQNKRGDDENFLRTAWTIQVARGVVLWVASWLIAWPAAAFYDHAPYRFLIPAAGFTAVLAGLESTSIHTLQRHLRLERLTALELIAQLIGTVVTILFAVGDRWMYGPNHPAATWAVIGGAIAASVVRVVLSHAYLPGIRHRFRLDRNSARELFRFGRWIFVSTLLTFLAGQSDRLMFGKLIPIAMFGIYSIAAMLAALPTQVVLKLGGAVVFPAYSRIASRDDFQHLFWRVRLPVLVGGAAMVAVLAGSGPFLVRFLYDERYSGAGWILQFLAVGSWFQILECTNGAALLAKGRTNWVAAGSAAKVAAMAVMIPVGFSIGGFAGALIGVVAAELIKYLTSATGAAAAGLRGLGKDLILTLSVAAFSIAAFASGRALLRSGVHTMAVLFVSAAIAGLPFATVAALYVKRRNALRPGGIAA